MLNYRKQTIEYARPWQHAGLDFLLIEDEVRYAEFKKLKLNVELAKAIFSPKVDTAKNLQSSPRSSEEAKEIVSAHKNSSIEIIKEHEWSTEWANLWAKIAKHTNPKIAWTYTGLHDDLMGNTNKIEQRQEIIRDLLKGLKSPNGTHTFIPFDKENEAGKLLTDDDISFFWSAASRFKVRHLFIFGSKTRDELLLPSRNVYSVIQFKNYRVYILPDINRLIGDTAETKALLEYLKNQLSLVKI